MTSREQKIRLVMTLLRMTIEKNLSWKKIALTAPRSAIGELTSAIYEADWENFKFRLYRTAEMEPEPVGIGIDMTLVKTNIIILDIVDSQGDCVDEISGVAPLKNLFDEVRSAVSDLAARLSKLIAKEPTHAQ